MYDSLHLAVFFPVHFSPLGSYHSQLLLPFPEKMVVVLHLVIQKRIFLSEEELPSLVHVIALREQEIVHTKREYPQGIHFRRKEYLKEALLDLPPFKVEHVLEEK